MFPEAFYCDTAIIFPLIVYCYVHIIIRKSLKPLVFEGKSPPKAPSSARQQLKPALTCLRVRLKLNALKEELTRDMTADVNAFWAVV